MPVLSDIDYTEVCADNVSGGGGHSNHNRLQTTRTKNQEFSTGISKKHLDLYLPNCTVQSLRPNGDNLRQQCSRNAVIASSTSTPPAPPPLIVFVHGGGWRRGHKQQWRYYVSAYDTNLLAALIFRFANLYRNIGESFVKNGIACAVISYPLMMPSLSVTLVELVISFLMSTLPIAAFFAVLMHFVHFACIPVMRHSLSVVNHVCTHHEASVPGYTVLIPSSILLSQLVIWTTICFNIQHYQPEHRRFLTLATPLTTTFLACVFHSWITLDVTSYFWTLSGLVSLSQLLSIGICQILFTHFHSRGPITCQDQVEAVARSIQWLKSFGQERRNDQRVQDPPYDTGNIVLMGHSAGSHLINMLVLSSDEFLGDFNLQRNNFKAVISLSGVHNLETLDTGLTTRYLYLSAFPDSRDQWDQLSPTKLIMSNGDGDRTSHLPRYLIISAEHDYDFLKKDATDYVKVLVECGCAVRYEVIPGTNHLTLAMRFGGSYDNGVLVQTCLEFVHGVSGSTR